MSFMIKKKKFKFNVDFLLEELTSVSFVNAVLFTKVRLLDGGSFVEISSREEVLDHAVKWNAHFAFPCKMNANASTGILDPCICRVSVRKELKGGRTYQKLGFADVNLAEFAGSGSLTKRYLLEGYDTKHRQDNSILRITVSMTLLSGDPCFKVPSSNRVLLPNSEDESSSVQTSSASEADAGIGSLTRKPQRPVTLTSGSCQELVTMAGSDETSSNPENPEDFELGHSRNSSGTSQQSKASGYSSLHSRQGSSESGHNRLPVSEGNRSGFLQVPTHHRQSSLDFVPGHPRTSSSSSAYDVNSLPKVPERKRVQKQLTEEVGKESRVDATRVDADDLINQLIKNTNLETDDTAEVSGLQLFVGKDGTTALGSQRVKDRLAGSYEPVVMNNR